MPAAFAQTLPSTAVARLALIRSQRLLKSIIQSFFHSIIVLLLTGCARFVQYNQLPDGYYQVRRASPDSVRQRAAGRVYVQQRTDTLAFTPAPTSDAVPPTWRYRLRPGQPVRLTRRSFDLDVFSIPFKVLAPRQGLPVQLNTNFNIALYAGHRFDFYRLGLRRSTPFGLTPVVRGNGFGYGLFAGMGSSLITPDVTGQRSLTGYEGFTLHGGAALIYDARLFNLGLALGTDHLLGFEGRYWLYQHKPWLGVLLGLDLN